jgi:NhaP-type Na+/H+ or K+/H+ antiporter
VWTPGVLIATFITLVARPVAVAIATMFDSYTPAERALLSWAGLRGGVAVVLATFPVLAHIPGSLQFFDIVFLTVVISTLVQGMTFEPLARRLGLIKPATPTASAAPAAPPPLPAARAFQRPWSSLHGDPAHPVRLDGVAVVEHLRSRPDGNEALVRLQDGRYALTGSMLTVAPAVHLRRYVDERVRRAGTANERTWWTTVAAAIGAAPTRTRRRARAR